MKIYLDDVRTPLDNTWFVVRSYDEFVNLIGGLNYGEINVISFDHDLGDTAMKEYFGNVIHNYTIDYDNITEKTGYDCIKWFVDEFYRREPHRIEMSHKDKKAQPALPLPEFRVHSANPIGGANILGYANNFLKNEGHQMTARYEKVEHTINH